MSKEALIIIDMLNDFVLPGAPLEVPKTREAIPAIKNEIEKARAIGSPVIYLCDSHDPKDKEFEKFGWPPHAVRGTNGADVVDELKPTGDDIIVEKTTYSGFYNTELEEILKKLSVESLRLTGCVTHICVMIAAYEAVLRDYKVTVVKDGVAGLAPEDHEAALRMMEQVLGAKIE
jgi:nicotinamidase-related amidase